MSDGLAMDVWRLLKSEPDHAFKNMAVDEAVLRARIGNLVPNTIRFYRWEPSAVSIGRFQNIEEVQLDNCRELGVDVVRRISGGGAVYHDNTDEITYSVVANREDLEVRDVTTIYTKMYGGLTETIKILGLKADFNGGNADTCPNLMIDGKKISGSAQSHKQDVFLQHGTLLLDVDLEKMFNLLRVPWAKTRMEVVDIAKHRITSLKKEFRREVSIERVKEALASGFQKALNVKLVEGKLTNHESKLAEKLVREKYDTYEWNFHGKQVQSSEMAGLG
jgi:lipoate-protein ligase A